MAGKGRCERNIPPIGSQASGFHLFHVLKIENIVKEPLSPGYFSGREKTETAHAFSTTRNFEL